MNQPNNCGMSSGASPKPCRLSADGKKCVMCRKPMTASPEEAQKPTCCKDCGLPNMHNVDHVCDEKGKARLATLNAIDPKDIVLTHGDCGTTDHIGGSDKLVSSDWKQKEREAWRQHYLFTPNEKLLSQDSIANYWIDRIKAAREEG